MSSLSDIARLMERLVPYFSGKPGADLKTNVQKFINGCSLVVGELKEAHKKEPQSALNRDSWEKHSIISLLVDSLISKNFALQ